MTKIFISHANNDSEFALKLAHALIDKGIDVWIDKSDIHAGTIWWDEIQRGLDECDKMILILSQTAMDSRNVADEWGYYLDEKKQIFPVHWLPAKINFRLRGLQYIDFHEQEFASAFEAFCVELQRQGISVSGSDGEMHEIRSYEATPPRSLSQGREQILSDVEDNSSLDSPPEPRSNNIHSMTPFLEGRITKLPYTSRGNDQSLSSTPIDTPKKTLRRVEGILPPPFEWCEIPAGQVRLEAGGYLKQPTTFDVPSFLIAKYPITNEQFERFALLATGYRESEWWNYSADAMQWHKENPQPRPRAFPGDTDPRANVTWYEAVAFCRWLNISTLSLHGQLSWGEFAPPSEQQWQRAAQADDGRIFAWGNVFDATKCNTIESGLQHTSSVTMYPQGASPYGVLDMTGNVWEWCTTIYETGEQTLEEMEGRVVRGGAWRSNQGLARVSYRNLYNANIRHFDNATGFRLCIY